MEFRLYYRGQLKSNGGISEKQKIRRIFHPQLRKLWDLEPLSAYTEGDTSFLAEKPAHDFPSVIYPLSNFRFACLISDRLSVHAEIDILFMRPESAGQIIKTGGDIDNRLKTLFDGLRRPLDIKEIPAGDKPQPDETPFYCLLSDDALISKVTVTTDQLLDARSLDEVVLIIYVRIKGRMTTIGNFGLTS